MTFRWLMCKLVTEPISSMSAARDSCSPADIEFPSKHGSNDMAGQDTSRVDIARAARENDAFRREIMTGEHEQVVVMTIPPGGEIGDEVHPDTDQVLTFVEGRAEAVLDGESFEVTVDDLVFVRAGTRHNFINRGDSPLRVITVYSPPEHPAGTVHRTKEEADHAEGH